MRIPRWSWFASWLVAMASLACDPAASGGGPDLLETEGPGIRVEMGALTYPGATDVCYSLAVVNGAGALVVGRGGSHVDPGRHPGGALAYGLPDGYIDPLPGGICASRYGDGPSGGWSFVAPCDASSAPSTHTVTVWLDALVLEGETLATPGVDYQDPCPMGCTVEATCAANEDHPARFDLTVMRRAQQGFVDLAIAFDDLFCSAKLDCEDEAGELLTLLHTPGTSQRGPTAVLAMACTTGPGEPPATILRDPIALDCGGDVTLLPPPAVPGNAYSPASPPPAGSPLWQVAAYLGAESQPCGAAACTMAYWNLAVGYDPTRPSCTLRTSATAGSPDVLPELSTPTSATYPIIEVEVPLTDAAGQPICTRHPLDGSPGGVWSTYTPVDAPRTFAGSSVGGAEPTFVSMTAIGGDEVFEEVLDGVPWRLHAFTTVGASEFTVVDLGTSGGEVQYLIVAGGGGGGSRHGGGGGAGGVIHNLGQGWFHVTPQTYPVVVGAGGSGAPVGSQSSGTKGAPSSLFGLTAEGGGFGSGSQSFGGGAGGSGGGGRGNSTHPGGAATPGQGSVGGAGTLIADGANSAGIGGGGGGFSQAGFPGDIPTAGDHRGRGGDGIDLGAYVGESLGVLGWFAGGGGAGGNKEVEEDLASAVGGAGGGGDGNIALGDSATPGVPGTGGGGGGGGHHTSATNYAGKDGGSGVVIIRYPLQPLE